MARPKSKTIIGKYPLRYKHTGGVNIYHGDDWAGCHVADESIEEWLAGQISVVLLQVLLGGLKSMQFNKSNVGQMV